MENVLSIYTGEQPCEYLHLSNDEFRSYFNQNWFGTHIWDCEDCIRRYTNSNRYTLAETFEEQNGLPD